MGLRFRRVVTGLIVLGEMTNLTEQIGQIFIDS